MPANLTPAYFEAEKRYRAAETPEEKLEALNEMLRVMPKHKGTDGLRAELRTKIAKFQKESAKQQATARKGGMYHVPKEGAGQIALVGLTNSGKSSLMAATTSAHVEVGDYPYTTRLPQPGMMRFENVQIQLVDMPPISAQDARPWFAAVLRAADALILMVDLEIDPVTEVEELLGELTRYSEPSRICRTRWATRFTNMKRLDTRLRQSSIVILATYLPPENRSGCSKRSADQRISTSS